MNIAEKVNALPAAKHIANRRIAKRFRVLSAGEQSNDSPKHASKNECKTSTSLNKYNFVGIAG